MTTDEAKELQRESHEAHGLKGVQWYRKIYLLSEHWKELRQKKFNEVGKQCELCGSTQILQCHHLNYRSIYDVTTDDLQVLCMNCHAKVHKKSHRRRTEKVNRTMKIIFGEHWLRTTEEIGDDGSPSLVVREFESANAEDAEFKKEVILNLPSIEAVRYLQDKLNMLACNFPKDEA